MGDSNHPLFHHRLTLDPPCVPSPSMRRPVDVKAHFCFLLFFSPVPIQLSRPCRHPSIRTLCERSSLGARWVFSFSRCCYLIIDLSSYLFGWELGPRS